jgi:hypothetical protein
MQPAGFTLDNGPVDLIPSARETCPPLFRVLLELWLFFFFYTLRAFGCSSPSNLVPTNYVVAHQCGLLFNCIDETGPIAMSQLLSVMIVTEVEIYSDLNLTLDQIDHVEYQRSFISIAMAQDARVLSLR